MSTCRRDRACRHLTSRIFVPAINQRRRLVPLTISKSLPKPSPAFSRSSFQDTRSQVQTSHSMQSEYATKTGTNNQDIEVDRLFEATHLDSQWPQKRCGRNSPTTRVNSMRRLTSIPGTDSIRPSLPPQCQLDLLLPPVIM